MKGRRDGREDNILTQHQISASSNFNSRKKKEEEVDGWEEPSTVGEITAECHAFVVMSSSCWMMAVGGVSVISGTMS